METATHFSRLSTLHKHRLLRQAESGQLSQYRTQASRSLDQLWHGFGLPLRELGNLHRGWAWVSTSGRKHSKTHNTLLIFYPQLMELTLKVWLPPRWGFAQSTGWYPSNNGNPVDTQVYFQAIGHLHWQLTRSPNMANGNMYRHLFTGVESLRSFKERPCSLSVFLFFSLFWTFSLPIWHFLYVTHCLFFSRYSLFVLLGPCFHLFE